jgi:hypothetical protein
VTPGKATFALAMAPPVTVPPAPCASLVPVTVSPSARARLSLMASF